MSTSPDSDSMPLLKQQDGLRANRDKLSELPDGVLISILERMDMSSAVATSLLSSRWRHLWKSIADFELRMDSFTPSLERSDAVVGVFTRPLLYANIRKLQQRYRHAFVRFVSSFLRANRDLRRLSLHFDMKNTAKYRKIVDGWVHRAAKAGVNELELVPCHRARAYEFPWRLLADGKGSFFTKLKLGRCRLGNDYDFGRLGSISRLHLADVNISQEIVTDILENCKRLESLTLESCPSEAAVSIAPPELQLKELVVCSCFAITSVKLSAPKLRRLQYYGDSALLSFKFVPCLEHVWLSYCKSDGASYAFQSLLPQIAHVSDLVLDFRSHENLTKPRLRSPFSNLKDLTVNVFTTYEDNLMWIAALLEAAPFLEKLQTFKKASEVPAGNGGGGISWQPTNDFQYRHLRDVRMHGFEGSDAEIAFARFVLQRAVLLRSLVLTGGSITPGVGWMWKHGTSYPCRVTTKDKFRLLMQITEGIASSPRIVYLV